MPTVHLLISGKVQGVFYRASAREKAEAIGITGWVRNTEEGKVEAMVTGTNDQIQSFIHWCERGPSNAVVANVSVTSRGEETFTGFKVLRG